MIDWDDAVAHALTLPGTELARHYGQPAVKLIANGRAFLSRGHEPAVAFCLQLDHDTIDLLTATDPATFFQTPHYVGYAAVLVRYDSPDPDRVRAMIERACAQAAEKPKARPRKP